MRLGATSNQQVSFRVRLLFASCGAERSPLEKRTALEAVHTVGPCYGPSILESSYSHYIPHINQGPAYFRPHGNKGDGKGPPISSAILQTSELTQRLHVDLWYLYIYICTDSRSYGRVSPFRPMYIPQRFQVVCHYGDTSPNKS